MKSYSGNRHNQEYIQRIEKSGARIIYRPRWSTGPFRVSTLSHMIWIILKVQPDVILTHLRLLSVGITVLSKLFWWRNTAVVLNEGILPSKHLKDELPNWRRRYWKPLMRWAYSRADRVIVPTRAVKRDLMNTFTIPSDKISVAKHWTVGNKQNVLNRRKLDEVYDLIYIGRLETQKNLSAFINIVRELQNHHPRLKACIVGTGALQNELRKEARSKKVNRTLDFAGLQYDVTPFLEGSKIFVLTSHYEGMPIALLEAKSVGIPAVIAAFEGADEVVDEGKDGYICHSRKEFINRIQQLLRDEKLRDQLGRYARKRAIDEFGISALQHFCNTVMETRKKETRKKLAT
ncbi:MAG TPA: glycosyltransferase [Patescibacteria group bacterium]|nr:glycosyltransferase [Patescibacteria group bacterium]